MGTWSCGRRKKICPLATSKRSFSSNKIPYCNYKTVKCKLYDKDQFCKFGQNCRFAHGDLELRSPHDPLAQSQVQQNQVANMVYINALITQPPPASTFAVIDKIPQASPSLQTDSPLRDQIKLLLGDRQSR